MSLTPEELGRKIKEARDRQGVPNADPEAAPGDKKMPSGASQALRAGTDLVSALVVGGLLGYWLDKWWSLKPLGMVLFIILGFMAGVLNVYRSQTGQDYKIGFKEDKK